jgi:predicted permease
MEPILRDLRFGVRLLWKDRGFAAAALLTLAICIGANVAIFAIVNAVLLRPLPVPGSEQLVSIYNSYPGAGVVRASTGVPDYYDRLEQTDVFEELALYQGRGITLGLEGADPQRIDAMAVRPSLFRLLRTQPIRGRLFEEADGEFGQHQKAIISDGLWREHFGGREDALSSTLRLNGESFTVIGILPAAFQFMDPDVRLWIPLWFSPEQKTDDARHNNSWTMVGRLKEGATVPQAQQQVDAINARNLDRLPALREVLVNAGFSTVVAPLQDEMVREARGALYLLWAGVTLLLVIGAVNLVNLVLVRSSARLKELATRHALGAGLPRLGRQLVTESVMLTVLGGLAGVLAGYWGLSLLTTRGLEHLPRASEIAIDGSALAFALVVALALGLALGLAPLLTLRQGALRQAFREEGRSGTSGRGARAVRRVLVAIQVGFAFVLLIGAGLLLSSFERVLAIDPGFQPTGLLTARVTPPPARYAGGAELRAFAGRFLERVRTLPGVEHAGLASAIPFGSGFSDSVILAEGYQMAPGESVLSPYRVEVSDGYLETLGVPVLAGRTFDHTDTEQAPRAIIVDERLAKRFWPDRDPIGRRMYSPNSPEDVVKPGPNANWYTVVGVVGSTKMVGLVTEDERPGTYYFPMTQAPVRTMTLLVRTSGEPASLAAGVRRELRALDPELPALQRADDGHAGAGVDDRPPYAHGAGARVRWRRALPGDCRPVRRAGVPGLAPLEGDRDPAGAWQRRTRDIRPRVARGADVAGHRPGRGRRRGVPDAPLHRSATLRCVGPGPGRHGRRRLVDGLCGGGSVRHPGPPRVAH